MSLQFYTGYTLVDITDTGVVHSTPEQEFERNQQRNWETVLQCIGLRAQPMNIQGPVVVDQALERMEFGEMYEGRHKVWAFTFSTEYTDVFMRNGNPVDLLESDYDQVPVIVGLSETARFMLPIFYTAGAIKNIYFKFGAIDLNNI